MNWIVTIIVGAIVGWLASMVMKTNAQMGMIANVVVGIIGANLGAWLAALIGLAPTSVLAAVIVAVIGASVLIGLLRALGIFK